MENRSPFDNILSSLTPLQRHTRPAGDKKANPVFKIKLHSDEPFIYAKKIKEGKRELSPQEYRLYNELKRLNADGYFSDEFSDDEQEYCISLWDNPYILNFIDQSVSIAGPSGKILNIYDEPADTILDISLPAEAEKAESRIILRSGEKDLPNPIFLNDRMALCNSTIYQVDSIGGNYSKLYSLLMPLERELLPSFLTLFLSFFDNITPVLNNVAAHFSKRTEHAVPTLYLEKVAADKALYLSVGVNVESAAGQLPPNITPTRIATIDDQDTIQIRRVEDCEIEDRIERLEKLIQTSAPNRQAAKEVYRNDNFFIIPEETAGPFLLNCLPQILDVFHLVGSEKLKEYKVVATKPKLNLRLSSGIDFLSGEGDVEIGNETFSISDILNQYSTKKYIQLGDGSRGIIDENYINRLQRLFRRRDKKGRIKVNLFDLPEVEELLESKLTGKFAEKSRKMLEGFNNLKNEKTPRYKVDAELRPYQNQGVKWLKYLFDNKLGGCLADDMGLGKTLQTIALLSLIYPKATRPSLIIMPRSLLFNWEKELKKFAPSLQFYTYYGPERNLEEAMKCQIILSSYAVVRNDIEKLKEEKFEAIILDESQNIKNVSSQTAASVMLLESEHRFALSGTPMENNLTELYSLFRFLNPTMFGRLEDFNASYTYPIQKNGDNDAADSLRLKIFPFILRRLKKDVLKDLPPRIDNTIYVEMSENQRKLYEERRKSYKLEIEKSIKTQGVEKSQFVLFQALSELRRIASVPESLSDGRVKSPKIDELLESIMASVENGHKSVVFFNFIAGLEIVGERLEQAGIAFESMTGSTSSAGRRKAVERFQADPECKVMLMTLKVGGVGLNLTAADTVYVFEPWWNKAAEEQAINRLHRIGQKKTVNAFSIITVGTIEERILQLQEQKSNLINDLIASDGMGSKHLSENDIEFILS